MQSLRPPARNLRPATGISASTIYRKLLHRHSLCHHLFDEMPQRDTVAHLNVHLNAQVRAGYPEYGLLLFLQMHCDGTPLDGYSFTPALTACAVLGHSTDGRGLLTGRQLHALGIKNGSLFGHISGTALLDMYAKCCDAGHPYDAIQVFNEMKCCTNRDVVAWNTLLSCFIHHSRATEAISMFQVMMMEEGIKATSFTLATLLKACSSLKTRRLGEQVHASIAVAGALDSVILGTALVDFYSNCGLMQQAMQVFNHLRCKKDVVAYNTLMHGCIQNGWYDEAFTILRTKMETTNATILTTALSACSEACNLQYGKQIHCTAIRRGFTHDTFFCNALLDMYAKNGVIDDAHSVFDLMNERNVVSWTSIIHAYGNHGRSIEAVGLFKEMEGGESGFTSPNSTTFLSILSACAHAGLVDEGRAFFASMKERHGIEPSAEHYASLIDLLGRAGQIEEAWDLFLGVSSKWVGGGCKEVAVTTSTMSTHVGVCVAMLNTCGACMDVEKGEMVAQQLLALEPEHIGVYILLSNFYAKMGMWGKVEELRSMIKKRGLRKEGGSSWG